MRKGFVFAVIGALMLPMAVACAAVDVAVIRSVALVYGASADNPDRRKLPDRRAERNESPVNLAAHAWKPTEATRLPSGEAVGVSR